MLWSDATEESRRSYRLPAEVAPLPPQLPDQRINCGAARRRPSATVRVHRDSTATQSHHPFQVMRGLLYVATVGPQMCQHEETTLNDAIDHASVS